MKHLSHLALAFAIFTLISCKNGTVQSVPPYETEVIEVPEYIDTMILYSEVFSKFELIPLEANESSILGSYDQLTVTETGDFLLFDPPGSMLRHFSKDGKFLNVIGRKGRQKSEYCNISSYSYNPYSNEVIVIDCFNQSVLFYSLDGTFLKSRKLFSCASCSLKVIDEQHLGFYSCDFGPGGSNMSYQYVVTSVDDCDNCIVKYTDFGFKSFAVDIDVFAHSAEPLCKSRYSNLIYELTADQLKPCYFVSYSDKTIPDDWFEKDKLSFDKKLFNNPDIVHCCR